MLHSDLSSERIGGPIPPSAYKRAVYRKPPAQFYVEVLPPQKIGSSYAYGMRICPLKLDGSDSKAELFADRKSTCTGSSSGSGSSSSQTKEYAVWRRWDDCLWFQDLLEMEYSTQSREKRRRLAQGKGVKKNGVYINSDLASSFESLPPGPDPNTIAKDIHEFLPRLTKKGTLFRASQATIEQRYKQFAALIDGLFQDNLPTLVVEIRESRVVRDFFGYWRRDRDFERKGSGENPTPPHTPGSSSWSLYFSPSTLSFQPPVSADESHPPVPMRGSKVQTLVPHTAHPPLKLSGPNHVYSDSELSRSGPRSPPKSAPTVFNRSTAPDSDLGQSSSDESDVHRRNIPYSNHQPRLSTYLAFPTSPTIPEDRSELSDTPTQSSPEEDSPVLGLSALPEDAVLNSPLSEPATPESLPPPVRRPHSSSVSDKRNRNCVIFTDTPPQSPTSAGAFLDAYHVISDNILADSQLTFKTSTNAVTNASSRYSSLFPTSRRSSWQIPEVPVRPLSGLSQSTVSSFDRFRADSPILPHSPLFADDEPTCTSYRTSMASMNSVMTDSSVDRILPRKVQNSSSLPPQPLRRSFSTGSRSVSGRYSQSTPVPEEESWSIQGDDLLDSYLYSTENTSSIESENNVGVSRISQHIPGPERFPEPFRNRPPGQFHLPWTPPMEPLSLKTPTSPSSLGGSVSGDTLAIKAFLTEDAIVSFRVPIGISYRNIRQKVYDKLVRQEGIPISGSFLVGYLPSRSPRLSSASSSRGRMRSSSVSRIETTNPMIRYLQTEEEWQEAVRSCEGKLSLRIFDSATFPSVNGK